MTNIKTYEGFFDFFKNNINKAADKLESVKYLKESLSEKIQTLQNLVLDLKDEGFIVNIHNGSKRHTPSMWQIFDDKGNYVCSIINEKGRNYEEKYIYILIYKFKYLKDEIKLQRFKKSEINLIDNFNKTLNSYGIKIDDASKRGFGKNQVRTRNDIIIYYLDKNNIYNSQL